MSKEDSGKLLEGAVERTQARAGQGADPSLILGDLRKLWLEIARLDTPAPEPGRPEAFETPPLTRACVLNLVLVLRLGSERGKTCEAMVRLVNSHPSRFIVLAEEEGREEAVSEVSVFCSLQASPGRKVCCEQIVVRAAPELLENLHQTVAALFVPDLTRYLWWQHTALCASPLYRRLAAMADRTIIDSCRFPSGREGLRRVIEAVGQRQHATLSDLNWARLTPWRELTAQLFDPPERRGLLAKISRVEIAFAGSAELEGEASGISQSALLYLGWLASRLGWTARRDCQPGETACLGMLGQTVDLRFESAPRPGHEGLLTGVTFGFSPEEEAAMGIAQAESMDSASVFVRIGAEPPVHHCFAFSPRPLHELLAQELSFAERDAGYELALARAEELAREWEGGTENGS